MPFDSLHKILGGLEHQRVWDQQKQFQQILDGWSEIVGPAVAVQAIPIAVQRKVLQVATSSSAWAQNLTFERRRILDKLNAKVYGDRPSSQLTDIRFSTAQWCDRHAPTVPLESDRLWQEHPSRVEYPAHLPDQAGNRCGSDPNQAFQHWAKIRQSQVKHLPLCPRCHCPTPEGELKRWSVCALCAARQWSGI